MPYVFKTQTRVLESIFNHSPVLKLCFLYCVLQFYWNTQFHYM